jgi:hypothetical protein
MFTAQQVLDAINGPAYLVDDDARFLLVGQLHWSAQVADARGQPQPASLVGRCLFEFIRGDDVQQLYRRILTGLRADPGHAVELLYRCDSPGMMRAFRMTVTALAEAGNRSFLFTSQIVRQAQRPPLPLFDYHGLGALLGDPTAPVLAICSLCHRVKAKAGDDRKMENWAEPEQYYREGGSSHVSLSHGLCPSCYAQYMVEVAQK